MTAHYVFLFDARFCSGCKACQAACKDKNNLPTGVLWRRVMEVAGGSWQQQGAAWENSVFSYNVSIACNHCLHPKCAGICPVNAYEVRQDGIVILDEAKCMGCGYCAWGCPYGAPQYDGEAGHMTKCNFCFDDLEQGLPPACVAACPLRVLDAGDMDCLPAPAANEIRLWDSPSESHPFPLPGYSHTQPRLAIKQHVNMGIRAERVVANLEEIQPQPSSSWEEVPLLLFSLLVQMAVGSLWTMPLMFSPFGSSLENGAGRYGLLPLLLSGACLGAGMLAAFAHLGTKKNALRVFTNLQHSSLSKEVFYTILFALSLCLMIFQGFLGQDVTAAMFVAAAAGFGLVHHMSQVYRLPAAPGWNTWRTNASFLVSTALLGLSAMTILLDYLSLRTGPVVPGQRPTATGIFILVLLAAQLAIMRKQTSQYTLQQVRIGLILIVMALAGIAYSQASSSFAWISILIPVIIVGEEILGRWLFYRSRL